MDYFDGVSFLGSGNMKHHTTIHKNHVFRGYYGIQYTHQGYLDFALGTNPITSVEGSWAFPSYPGETFYYGPPPGKDRQHTYICFKGPKIDQFIRSGLFPINKTQPLVKIVYSERFLATMLSLIELIQDKPHRNFRAVLLLEDLLLQLHEQPVDAISINSHLKSGIRQLADEIRLQPQLDWDVQKEAATLGISYPHFRRLFKQLFGTPPGHFINNCRLQHAADMLLHSDKQISSIAEACGFSDEFYFSRLFKKYYQLSPFKYRKEFSQ